ncbi:GNAT family N-acetyltransferase [Sorangium sp. So ce296]|uniref:GNAT family N-acetyltransferase n=1 Tax=unclassified Sorangium TaxID=2621164 RepID=UPI000B1C89B8
MSSTISVAAAGPEHLAGLEALFEAAGTPCYCRYYHFEGTNNEWLARCSDGQGENRREFAAALAARSDEARGVVALAQGAADVVGWLKVAPAAAVAKAYERRLYRGLPCFAGDRAGVFLIGCAVVHPRHRRRGVATALVAGAVELAPAWGARALEALPRRPREPVSDEELWTGPVSAFTRNGFVEVHTFEPYPVLRRTL